MRPAPHPGREVALVSPEPDLGVSIRRARLARSMSQQDLAGDLVSSSYVSLVEAGKRTPSGPLLEALAARLGCTVQELRGAGRAREDDRLALAHAEFELAHGDPNAGALGFARLTESAEAGVRHRAVWGRCEALEAAGRLEEAVDALEVVREQARAEPQLESLVRCALALSRCCREVGDLGRAVDVAEEGLTALQRLRAEDSDLAVDLLCTLAAAHQERGDLVRAGQLLVRVRRTADALGTPRARGAALWNASALASDLGQHEDAVELAHRALALFGEGDDARNLARLRNAYGSLLLRILPDGLAEAWQVLTGARAQLLEVGSQVDIAYCETELSRAATLLGRPREGEETALSALARLGTAPRLETAQARQALAYALWAQGRHAEARAEYGAAAASLHDLGVRRKAAAVWLEVSQLARTVDDVASAHAAAVRALEAAGLQAAFPPPPRLGADADPGGAARRA